MMGDFEILDCQREKLMNKIEWARRVACEVGPLHSYWDWISEAEMILRRGGDVAQLTEILKGP